MSDTAIVQDPVSDPEASPTSTDQDQTGKKVKGAQANQGQHPPDSEDVQRASAPGSH